MGSNQSWILNNEIVQKNLSKILELRVKRNMSRYELGRLIGVSYNTVCNYECGAHYPTRSTYNRLALLFGWDVIDGKKQYKPVQENKFRNGVDLYEQTKEDSKGLHYRFEIGKCYTVSNLKYKDKNDSCSKTTWDANCVFRYEGKQGIHHCFREINGGWTRTYTDYQLIGKYVTQIGDKKNEEK